LGLRETTAQSFEISIGRETRNRLTDKGSLINLNSKENIGSPVLQRYVNSKRRKIAVLKNDDYLPY